MAVLRFLMLHSIFVSLVPTGYGRATWSCPFTSIPHLASKVISTAVGDSTTRRRLIPWAIRLVHLGDYGNHVKQKQ